MFIFILLASLLFRQIDTALPIGQVAIVDTLSIYAEPNENASPVTRVRYGDVVLVYEIDGDWGRTDDGWLLLAGLSLEAAVVNYGVASDDLMGVVAIFQGDTLVYGEDGVMWIPLDELQLTPPAPDLRDFVQQRAYIKVEQVDLLENPDSAAAILSTQSLGREVTVLHEDGEWVLVKTDTAYGWSMAENFDILPVAQVRGEMNASPVNLRYTPDGRVIAVMNYHEAILVVGRDVSSEWLLIRQADGNLEGWVATQFVDFAGELEALPRVDRENQ